MLRLKRAPATYFKSMLPRLGIRSLARFSGRHGCGKG